MEQIVGIFLLKENVSSTEQAALLIKKLENEFYIEFPEARPHGKKFSESNWAGRLISQKNNCHYWVHLSKVHPEYAVLNVESGSPSTNEEENRQNYIKKEKENYVEIARILEPDFVAVDLSPKYMSHDQVGHDPLLSASLDFVKLFEKKMISYQVLAFPVRWIYFFGESISFATREELLKLPNYELKTVGKTIMVQTSKYPEEYRRLFEETPETDRTKEFESYLKKVLKTREI